MDPHLISVAHSTSKVKVDLYLRLGIIRIEKQNEIMYCIPATRNVDFARVKVVGHSRVFSRKILWISRVHSRKVRGTSTKFPLVRFWAGPHLAHVVGLAEGFGRETAEIRDSAHSRVDARVDARVDSWCRHSGRRSGPRSG